MANFPASLDVLTDPATNNKLNSPSHAGQHIITNAILQALEAKVGVTASTPSAGKVLKSTGAGLSAWAQVDPSTDIATMTSATLRGLLTDETGTGFAMFSTAPAFTNPTITGGGSWTDGEFIGGVVEANVFTDSSALPKSVSLPANRAYLLLDRLEVSASFTLTIPATSSMEIVSYGRVSDMNAANAFIANSQHNAIINGRCAVAQRDAPTLTGTYAYGQVDRWAVRADGTVGAGTATQSTSPNAGSTGYSIKLSGVTLSGATGFVYIRYRMEAKDALNFKNKAASFACQVYHDAGSTLPYKITIRKPTVADTFTTTNDIAAKNVNVATATNTRITFENIANGNIGDVSNGLEIEIRVDCGAISTKNFEFTEFVMNIGATANTFVPRPYQEDLANCQRYCYSKTTNGVVQDLVTGMGYATGTTRGVFMAPVAMPMRANPTISGTGSDWQLADGVAAGIDGSVLGISSDPNSTSDTIMISLTCSGATSKAPYIMRGDAGNNRKYVLDAEL